jgi:cystathionine beta-lyase
VVNPPVWRASTHLYDDVAALKRGPATNEDGRFFYGRRGGPTQWALAEALSELEPGAAGTALFCSGVAAVTTALLSVLAPGDRLLMTDNAYDPSRAFADGLLARMGVETVYFDPLVTDLAPFVTPSTRAVLLESPGSLTFEVADVPALAASARQHGLTVLLDNSWATPLLFTALDKGVDMAILACTKYVVGHSDAMLGSVTANAATWPALRRTAQALGHVASPDDAWLGARGLRTLVVRLAQHDRGARAVADWLAGQPRVARILHPADPGNPGHATWVRDFAGASGLFAVELAASEAEAAAFVDALSLFSMGYSWGGFESLAIPVDPARCRSAVPWQARGALIRLHIGLEDPADLIADLASGLDRFRAAT